MVVPGIACGLALDDDRAAGVDDHECVRRDLQHGEVDHLALAGSEQHAVRSRRHGSPSGPDDREPERHRTRTRVQHRDGVLRRVRCARRSIDPPAREPTGPDRRRDPRWRARLRCLHRDERLGHDGEPTLDRDREADAGRDPPAKVHRDRSLRGEVHRLGLQHATVEPGANGRGGGHGRRVGDDHRLGPARGDRRVGELPMGRELGRAEGERQTLAAIRAVQSLGLLGDHPAPARPDLGGHEIGPSGLVLDRDGDPAVGRHHEPWRSPVPAAPELVRKSMSTIASSANGLNSARNSCAPFTVVPAAKCHCGAASRAHGPKPASPVPVTEWVTIARPPVTSTSTPGSAIARMSATWTDASEPGATSTVFTFAAWSGPCMTVTRAWATRWSTFAMKIRSSARPPGLDVPSAQYHAVSTAFAAGTRGPSATSSSGLLPDELGPAFDRRVPPRAGSPRRRRSRGAAPALGSGDS